MRVKSSKQEKKCRLMEKSSVWDDASISDMVVMSIEAYERKLYESKKFTLS